MIEAPNILIGPKERWQIVHDSYEIYIEDIEHHLRLFSICSSGFGHTTDSIVLARRVCVFLNTLPQEITLLYPYKK